MVSLINLNYAVKVFLPPEVSSPQNDTRVCAGGSSGGCGAEVSPWLRRCCGVFSGLLPEGSGSFLVASGGAAEVLRGLILWRFAGFETFPRRCCGVLVLAPPERTQILKDRTALPLREPPLALLFSLRNLRCFQVLDPEPHFKEIRDCTHSKHQV